MSLYVSRFTSFRPPRPPLVSLCAMKYALCALTLVLRHLSGIGAKLGEAGNETFRKVFWFEEDELLREQACLTETDYWR